MKLKLKTQSRTKPALHVETSLGALDVELAAGTPLPVLRRGELHQHDVLRRALVGAQPPELLARDPRVPPHPARRAEHPVAARTRRLRHVIAAVVEHRRRAVLERTVERLPRPQHQRLAQRHPPPLEHLAGEHPPAPLRLQRRRALRPRARNRRHVVGELRRHVLRRAVGAVGVLAGSAGEGLFPRLLVGADPALEPRRRRGLAGLGDGGEEGLLLLLQGSLEPEDLYVVVSVAVVGLDGDCVGLRCASLGWPGDENDVVFVVVFEVNDLVEVLGLHCGPVASSRSGSGIHGSYLWSRTL